ncbi:MAG: DUF3857 domain-containing protein, partial [Polyangiaceae bacterium]|nr:DUF3857 domain-containing protein [Polyangiaceae bacterium]
MAVQLAWAQELAEAELEAESWDAVARARAAAPHSCAALGAEVRRLRERLRYSEAHRRVDELVRCNARTLARYDLLFRQRRWEEARVELDALEALLEPEQRRARRMELAVASGDESSELTLRDELAGSQPDRPIHALYRGDLRLAAHDMVGAVRMLDQHIEENPASADSLRHVRRTLTGTDELDRYRVDGLQVIREFEASGRTYADRGQVLVFDYMVTRIYPDGSARHIIHQIFRVQSEESIEALGQVRPPGTVLTLRSIKPGGRILEPDAIAGLDSIPMTDLAIGDYVEYEVVRQDAPNRNGGFDSGGWLFQAFDQPFELSKIVVVVPEDLPLVVDARGAVPEVEETRDGKLRILSWTARQMPQLVQEPGSVSDPAILPSLRLGVYADWASFLERVRDGLSDRAPFDPAAKRLVRQILGRSADAPIEERARILRQWVLDNVEGASVGNTPVPLALAARRGDRTSILQYLLELAGADAKLVIVRPFGSAPLHPELYDARGYTSSLLHVTRPGAEPLFLWAEDRGAPFDYVPPPLRGQPGLLVQEGFPEVRITDAGPSYDGRSVEIDLTLASDGSSASLEIVETLRGAVAIGWRKTLNQVPPADLERVFGEAYAAEVIPGAAL